MAAIVQRLGEARASGVLGQLVRFVIVGGLSTVVYSIVYLPLADHVMPPVFASIAGFLVAVVFGYFLHSRWSFRGHGAEGGPGTQFKFFVVQGAGMVLNAAFTWALTGGIFPGPTWLPLIPVVCVTPLVTFALNRLWVFG